ncbi:hypothetical protein [Clostridium botulinum]|uniref:hypothetical protein n=1 Tax=Clostridium botulinum TaxID=1491 RepID=UPI000A17641B|nr:hypothetical protein [Clostridium botulinum]OSA81295.1 hypothetical protein B2H89_03355 [Clostridium botulinum]
MSQETENIKLFKYDKETDDFNTTTFNITQALNNNWDKIDSKYEDTTKDLTEIKETNEKQQKDIDKMMGKLSFMTCIRKEKKSGYYIMVYWLRKDGTEYARSVLTGDTSADGEFTPKNMTFLFYDEKGTPSAPIATYSFGLVFDKENGDLIEMRLL